MILQNSELLSDEGMLLQEKERRGGRERESETR
jgi:hypothetical protein